MTEINSQTRCYSLEAFPTASFTTASNFTYHYIYIPSSQPKTHSTILIVHGFPSIPYDFHHQIHHLTSLGHGILAPYLLGYAPTSTPRDPNAYRLKSMSADIISLLDHLGLTSPIPAIGHDWGVTFLSRLEYYHPSRFSKLAYLTIAPSPFGSSFDLDKVNAMTKQFMGYEGFGYQKFFLDDRERASSLLEANHERMDMLMFAKDSTQLWKKYFGMIGGLERWLAMDQKVDTIGGVTDELLTKRKETFMPKHEDRDLDTEFDAGYGGPLMWYVGLNTDINSKDEQSERSDWKTYKTDKDILLVLSDKDPISLPDMQASMVEGYMGSTKEQLRVETLISGHFITLETPAELAIILGEFFAAN